MQYVLIITYQVITGNYSYPNDLKRIEAIITYQVITGNYSIPVYLPPSGIIITYQVITGNYSTITVKNTCTKL